MTEWNREYLKPDRSHHKPQQNAHAEFCPELDIARGEIVMNDGRPAVIEDWWDCDSHIRCRTAFYSKVGTDTWPETAHYSYLEANGLLEGKTYPDRGVGLTTITDTSGNEFWSASVAMERDADD